MQQAKKKRKPKGVNDAIVGAPSYYGLAKRVAAKLGLSYKYVCNVKTGFSFNARVAEAIEAERRLMDRERAS